MGGAVTVKEALKILTQCDEDRTIYVRDKDGTAQPVAAIVDLRHVNLPIDGISIPDDIALMAAQDFTESASDDEGNEPVVVP